MWRQIVADVTGRAFAAADSAEPGALGVAGVLAGTIRRPAGGTAWTAQAVAACCTRGEPVLPDSGAHAEYRPRSLERYRRLRRDLVEEQETQRAERERAASG